MSSQLSVLLVCEQREASQEIGLLQPAAATASGLVIETCAVAELGEEEARRLASERLQRQRPNALILSRFSLEWGSALISQARQAGIASLFHIDDDLLAVPDAIGAAKARRYNDPAYQARLRRLLQGVNLVLTSTPPLAARLEAELPGQLVRSLSFHRCHIPTTHSSREPAPQPVLGYMGSGSHQRDLQLVLPALHNLLRRYPTLRFETFGLPMPAELTAHFGPRTLAHPRCGSYEAFMERLGALGWWIGLGPLGQNGFNACKCDVKWVEYSEAGIAMVASAFGPYAPLGPAGLARTCATPHDWEAAIEALLLHRGAREEQLRRSLRQLQGLRSAARMARDLRAAITAARQQLGTQSSGVP
jgi:hypothetical protein